MKSSGIGGQAVLEGIMMKNGDRYAVAVRKPDGQIALDAQEYPGITKGRRWMEIPFLRGIFRFVDSLVLGMRCLSFSASFYEEEEEGQQPEKESFLEKKLSPEQLDKLMMGVAVAAALALSIGIFMVLPVAVAGLLRPVVSSSFGVALLEGVIRMAIFICYVALIALMKDIKRTYMYHGAEHKCINCIEHGMPLTVENVRVSSKEHKRCGTSFLLLVMVISILVFMVIRVDNIWLRMLSRVLLVPFIAGVAYEFIRLAGSSENPVVNALSRPGLWLQGLTTREPEDDMIQVAIQAVEAVFDWKAYEAENFGLTFPEEAEAVPAPGAEGQPEAATATAAEPSATEAVL